MGTLDRTVGWKVDNIQFGKLYIQLAKCNTYLANFTHGKLKSISTTLTQDEEKQKMNSEFFWMGDTQEESIVVGQSEKAPTNNANQAWHKKIPCSPNYCSFKTWGEQYWHSMQRQQRKNQCNSPIDQVKKSVPH